MGDWQPIDDAAKAAATYDNPVLVAVAGGEYNASVAFWLPQVRASGGLWVIHETNRVLTVAPTHWQPLPAPPEVSL